MYVQIYIFDGLNISGAEFKIQFKIQFKISCWK